MSRINYFECFEDGGATLMDRILGNAGTAITQATISAIALKVYECTSKENAINAVGDEVSGVGGSLTVADYVYDTLQTAAPWSAGGTGYNFRYNAAAAIFPSGSKWYRLEFKFTPATGAPFFVVWVGFAEPIAMS